MAGFVQRCQERAEQLPALTNYYQRHPVVLVRLSKLDMGALSDLLSMSWRLTLAKARRSGKRASSTERIDAVSYE